MAPCSKEGVPTCLWGTCVNGSASVCECFEGYVHDELMPRYQNCAIPLKAFYALGGVCLAMNVLSALINLYVGRTTRKKSLLRSLTVSAFLANVFFTAMIADLLIYRRAGAQTLVFYVIAVCSTCFAFSYLFLSVLFPVSRISRALASKFEPWQRFWLYFVPVFITTGMTISIIAAYIISPDNNQRLFNNWIVSQAAIFILIVGVATPAFALFTHLLINALKEVIDVGARLEDDEERNNSSKSLQLPRQQSANDADFGAAASNRQLIVRELLSKVIFIRWAIISAGTVLFVVAIATFVIQLVYDTVPMFWVVLLLCPLGTAIITLEMAYYTGKRQESDRRSTLAKVVDFGRQLSDGIKQSNLSARLKRFGSLREGRDGENAGDDTAQRNHGNFALHIRQATEAPMTVPEEHSLRISYGDHENPNAADVS